MPQPATLLKKRLSHRCFPENFVKSIRTPCFIEHLQWLLLLIVLSTPLRLNMDLLKRFQDSCSRGKLPSNPKTNPNPNPIPNQGGGGSFPRGQLSGYLLQHNQAAQKKLFQRETFLKYLKFTGKYLCWSFNLVQAQLVGCNFAKRAPFWLFSKELYFSGHLFFREFPDYRFKSSEAIVFCKKGFLKNFEKFTGKHL